MAVPLKSTTADAVAKAIFRELISTFGCPSIETTDRGPQFHSPLFDEFIQLLGAKHISTTAYHPCSNGIVEKSALASFDDRHSWVENLPLVILSFRSVIKKDLHSSTADIVFGKPPVLPGQFFSNKTQSTATFTQFLQGRMSKIAFTVTRNYTRDIFVPSSLKTCEFVFVRQDAVKKPLSPSYNGPYRVLSRNDKYSSVQMPNGSTNISIDRLKPGYVENDANQSSSEEEHSEVISRQSTSSSSASSAQQSSAATAIITSDNAKSTT